MQERCPGWGEEHLAVGNFVLQEKMAEFGRANSIFADDRTELM